MIRLYVGDRRKGVRCERLWRAWTEVRLRCEWIAGIHGVGMGHVHSVGQAALARPRSLFLACVTLVDTARQDEGTPTLFAYRVAKQRQIDRRAQCRGRTHDGERLQEKKKTCCSRHFGSSLFQSLRVTRHVPFMVWRDWPSWSGDSEVSCGGTRLDRRRTPQYHVRAVVATEQQEADWVDGASAACAGHRRWKTLAQELHGNGEVADNEVASHPLIANLFHEICAENPELPALVSDITTAAKEALVVPNPTTTPGELREEALHAQSLQQECGSEEAETPEIEVRREVSCAELPQAKKWVVSDSIGQRAGCPSSLGHSKDQVARRKVGQPERRLSWTRPCWMPVVLF